ncbi:MAG: metallophosphoesterase [Oscillospiraceae bacterium]|nr:metallophosphoesterase [Oscillospiraceae bacterium]
MKKLAVLLLAAMFVFTACSSNPRAKKEEVTLFHATDMHYLSQQLTDNSNAFVEMVKSGDGKMTHYGEQITEAFVEAVISQNPDAVLIGGDITFNCEKLSHEDFIAKLRRIEEEGIDVLCIPGNHDVEYPFSRGYEGEFAYKTDYTTEEDFVAYYKEFGPDIAQAVSPDGLSYIAQVGKNVYVAAIYTPQSFMTGGILCEEETLDWLDAELAKLPADARIVSLTHQNIVNHYPDDAFSFEYTVYNADELTKVLTKHGVDVNLSGHMHLQHIQETDSGLVDIATASMTIRNCHYGVVDIDNSGMVYNVQEIPVQRWAEENNVTDKNLLDFTNYRTQFYFESAYQKSWQSVADMKIPDSEKQALATLWADFNVNYFAGTMDVYYPQMINSEGYRLWQQYGMEDNWSFNYIRTALSNGTAEKSQLHWEKSFE